MIKLYPESALTQLEFDKIKLLLAEHCKTVYAKLKAENLRIHTRKEYIEIELRQTFEYKLLLQQGQYFPSDFTLNLSKELKLLGIDGATLKEDEMMDVKRLSENMSNIFRWFDAERRMAYSALANVIEHSYYEKNIKDFIEIVLDEYGTVRDTASADLQKIRMSLYKKRNELRRTFEKVLQKLAKAGYSADIDESFSSGRRVVAVFAEHKRQVKGILHGESDSRKTAFIEPEETIELNNELYSLEGEE
jgi:DNA mismatch repair protein MutS2